MASSPATHYKKKAAPTAAKPTPSTTHAALVRWEANVVLETSFRSAKATATPGKLPKPVTPTKDSIAAPSPATASAPTSMLAPSYTATDAKEQRGSGAGRTPPHNASSGSKAHSSAKTAPLSATKATVVLVYQERSDVTSIRLRSVTATAKAGPPTKRALVDSSAVG